MKFVAGLMARAIFQKMGITNEKKQKQKQTQAKQLLWVTFCWERYLKTPHYKEVFKVQRNNFLIQELPPPGTLS